MQVTISYDCLSTGQDEDISTVAKFQRWKDERPNLKMRILWVISIPVPRAYIVGQSERDKKINGRHLPRFMGGWTGMVARLQK